MVETYVVVAMQQGDPIPPQLDLAKPTEQLHPKVGRKEFPIGRMEIDVAQHGIDWHTQRMKNRSQLGQHIRSTNIPAMQYRPHPSLCKDVRRLRRGRDITVCIG